MLRLEENIALFLEQMPHNVKHGQSKSAKALRVSPLIKPAKHVLHLFVPPILVELMYIC